MAIAIDGKKKGSGGAPSARHPKRPRLFFRMHFGPCKHELVWGPLTTSRAFGLLQNPRYAGAYAYGRCQQHPIDTDGRVVVKDEPRERWHTLMIGAHAGYISWEKYEENLARM